MLFLRRNGVLKLLLLLPALLKFAFTVKVKAVLQKTSLVYIVPENIVGRNKSVQNVNGVSLGIQF